MRASTELLPLVLPFVLPLGRLSRSGFWLRHVTLIPIAFWVVIAAGQSPGNPYDLVPAMLLLAMLVSVWGRRLHDRGRSAWWLLSSFVPVIGALWLIVECGLRGPAAGAQRYGAPPGLRAAYLSVQPVHDAPHDITTSP